MKSTPQKIVCDKCNKEAVGTSGHVGRIHRKCKSKIKGKLHKDIPMIKSDGIVYFRKDYDAMVIVKKGSGKWKVA